MRATETFSPVEQAKIGAIGYMLQNLLGIHGYNKTLEENMADVHEHLSKGFEPAWIEYHLNNITTGFTCDVCNRLLRIDIGYWQGIPTVLGYLFDDLIVWAGGSYECRYQVGAHHMSELEIEQAKNWQPNPADYPRWDLILPAKRRK